MAASTEPIRDKEELRKLFEYYKLEENKSERNHALISIGLNTALRIGDILNLKWDDVYDFPNRTLRKHIELSEDKTNKYRKVIINTSLRTSLRALYRKRKPKPEHYIFSSERKPEVPISRIQAYRIVTKAAKACLKHPEHISCHSLRKTFGYHAWKQGIPLVIIMQIYNHSSFEITKRYLGINQDEQDEIFINIKYW